MKRTLWMPILAIALLSITVACDSSNKQNGDDPVAKKKITELSIEEMGSEFSILKFTYNTDGRLVKTESTIDGTPSASIEYSWTETSMEQKFIIADEVTISKYQIKDGRLISGAMEDILDFSFQYDQLLQLEKFIYKDDNYQESVQPSWKDGKISSLLMESKFIDPNGEENKIDPTVFEMEYAQDKCFGAILPYSMVDFNLPDLSMIHPELIGMSLEYPVTQVNLGGEPLVEIENEIDSEGYITRIVMTALEDEDEQVILSFKWE